MCHTEFTIAKKNNEADKDEKEGGQDNRTRRQGALILVFSKNGKQLYALQTIFNIS